MPETKKKILVFVDWYLPGYKAGGPIRSVAGLADRLSGRYDIAIVTGDKDLKDAVRYKDVLFDEWNKSGNGSRVMYCSPKNVSFKNFKRIIESEKPDIIYLNSMYSAKFMLLPLTTARLIRFRSKIIVAPRGMLSKGALAIKPFKKKTFLTAAKSAGLFRNVTFHASTDIEMNEVRSVFGDTVKVKHAINLTPVSAKDKILRIKKAGEVHLVFLGRISKVKNLLQCLNLLKQSNSGYNFTYDIFGPFEDKEYYELCRKEAGSMPGHVDVTFKGETDNSRVEDLLENYHFMFQLSKNENFGHAIVEAFSAGLPVIISDHTPWRNLASHNCGWDLNLSDEKTILEKLNYCAAMDQEEYNKYSAGATEYASAIRDNKKAVDDHISLFET